MYAYLLNFLELTSGLVNGFTRQDTHCHSYLMATLLLCGLFPVAYGILFNDDKSYCMQLSNCVFALKIPWHYTN